MWSSIMYFKIWVRDLAYMEWLPLYSGDMYCDACDLQIFRYIRHLLQLKVTFFLMECRHKFIVCTTVHLYVYLCTTVTFQPLYVAIFRQFVWNYIKYQMYSATYFNKINGRIWGYSIEHKSFHYIVCLPTDLWPLSQWVFHSVWFSAFSFKFQ